MRLCINQKVFSWTDKFTVKDTYGEERYFVEGEFFSWGKKLHVYDTAGSEVAFISQRLLTFLPKYDVYVNGRHLCQIVKEFTFFKPRYTIYGLDWTVDGDFWNHDYTISEHQKQIASIHKEWFSWGDCYVADIHNDINEIMALAVVLTIDCVLATQNSQRGN